MRLWNLSVAIWRCRTCHLSVFYFSWWTSMLLLDNLEQEENEDGYFGGVDAAGSNVPSKFCLSINCSRVPLVAAPCWVRNFCFRVCCISETGWCLFASVKFGTVFFLPNGINCFQRNRLLAMTKSHTLIQFIELMHLSNWQLVGPFPSMSSHLVSAQFRVETWP